MLEKWHERLVLILSLAATAAASSCDSDNKYVAPPPPVVHVATPLKQTVNQCLELTGNTVAINSVDIEARIQGFLTSVDYQDGTAVKKGDQLFSIQRDAYEAQLEQAKASLASAQASQVGAQQEYDRQINLSRQQVTTQTSVDSARAQLDEANANILNAKAGLDIATINLGYTTVTAPFDGRATNHLVDVGALVGVSGPTKLATLVQMDPLNVYFNVSEAQVLAIRQELVRQGRTLQQIDLPNIVVEIGLQSEEGYPHKGHLDYASPQVDASTGTLSVRGVFENGNQSLLPGLFVRVRVSVGRRDDMLLVPDTAIGTNQQGSYLLVVGEDNVLKQKPVKTGQRDGALRVIESGLEPQDLVVVQGTQQAAPGAKVEPQKVEIASAETKPTEPAAKAKTP